MQQTAAIDHSDLLLELYRLSNQSAIGEFQDQALQLLNRSVRFDASMWGTAEIKSDGIAPSTLHLLNKPPQMMQEYDRVKHLDKAAAGMFLQPRATRGFHSASLFPERHEREMLDFLRRNEHNNVFITAARNMETEFIQWISLFRAEEDHHCSAEDTQKLTQLAPHLMQALAFNRMRHLATKGPAEHAAKRLFGSAIADFRGVLLHTDGNFCDMLQNEWGGAVPHTLPTEPLQHFAQGHMRFKGHTLVLFHSIEHGMLFLYARHICLADKLSPRELTVARMVSKGSTYKEIAQNLHRAPATVRNHIQAIHQKLEVGHIAELIEALQLADFRPRA